METQTNSQEFGAVRFTDYLRFIRERWWVVAVITVVLVGGVAFMTSRQTPRYTTSAEVIHLSGGWEAKLLGLSSYYYYAQRIPVDAQLLASLDMAGRTKTLIGSNRSAEQLRGMIDVTYASETETIKVRATSADPQEAAAVANGFAQAYVNGQEEDMRASLEGAKATLDAQIKAIPSKEPRRRVSRAGWNSLKRSATWPAPTTRSCGRPRYPVRRSRPGLSATACLPWPSASSGASRWPSCSSISTNGSKTSRASSVLSGYLRWSHCPSWARGA